MACPPTLYAYELAWPPPPRPDADHVWVLDHENEKVVEVEGDPHLLTPIKKVYTDPYGLTKKIPRKPIDHGGCPLCQSLFVSRLCCCFWNATHVIATSSRTNPHVHCSCSVWKDPAAWRICPRSRRRRSGDFPRPTTR